MGGISRRTSGSKSKSEPEPEPEPEPSHIDQNAEIETKTETETFGLVSTQTKLNPKRKQTDLPAPALDRLLDEVVPALVVSVVDYLVCVAEVLFEWSDWWLWVREVGW